MAKIIKSAPKRSVSANNKKSSKGFLSKKFNLQSRKVQFFVVILIVAVLGGGYYTYKSFAATPELNVYTLNAYSDFDCGQYCKPTVDPSKNNATVWTLTSDSGKYSFISSKKPYYFEANKTYQFCSFVKGGTSDNSGPNIAPRLTDRKEINSPIQFHASNSNNVSYPINQKNYENYAEYCYSMSINRAGNYYIHLEKQYYLPYIINVASLKVNKTNLVPAVRK